MVRMNTQKLHRIVPEIAGLSVHPESKWCTCRHFMSARHEQSIKSAYYCQQVFLQLTQFTGWKGLSRQCVSAH
jgi:hypothetical protein